MSELVALLDSGLVHRGIAKRVGNRKGIIFKDSGRSPF